MKIDVLSYDVQFIGFLALDSDGFLTTFSSEMIMDSFSEDLGVMESESEVATFLLRNKYYLTALEFHQELVEHPDKSLVPSILSHRFGSLPDMEQVEDIDELFSKDLSLPSVGELGESGEGNDKSEMIKQLNEQTEHIQMLEYNLRKANEAVESLRKQKETAREEKNVMEVSPEAENIANELESAEEMKRHEQRTINYLIKNFLVKSGYKFTAITFSDEVSDQDVDSWDDVGLHCSEPPSLLSFYRYFYNAGPNQFLNQVEEEAKEYKKKAAKWKARAKRIPELEGAIHELKASLKLEMERKEKGISSSGDNRDIPDFQIHDLPKTREEEEGDISILGTRKSKSIRFAPMKLPEIRKIAWVEENSSVVKYIQNVSILGKEEDGPIRVMGASLPVIVPSVLLKARKEILPPLLITIQGHPDPQIRDTLTNLLFNLIKKPDEQQRQMIIIGCVTLAKLIGKERTEGELFPQCWEQINSKYEERRVLVAESCGALAAYTKSSMRVSLILSIIIQLLDDKSSLVREATVKNLAQLISFFEDDDKYSRVELLLLKIFYDSCKEVVDSLQSVLIPVFREWSNYLGLLLTSFVPLFTEEVAKLLKNMDPSRINESDVSRVEILFDTIRGTIPQIKEAVLVQSGMDPGAPLSKPNLVTVPTLGREGEEEEEGLNEFGSSFGIKDDSTILDDRQQSNLFDQFEKFVENLKDDDKENGAWEQYQWLDDYISKVIDIICRSGSLEATRICEGMSVIVNQLCTTFGSVFTQKVIVSKFEDVLLQSRNFFKSSKELELARKRVTPVYLLGVLTTTNDEDLIQFLKTLIVNVADCDDGWNAGHYQTVEDSLVLLCSSANKSQQIITLLTKDLTSSASPSSRLMVTRLFEKTMFFMSSSDLEEKLLPALVALSKDTSSPVRISCVQQMCNSANMASAESFIRKIDSQFDVMLGSRGHDILLELLKQFTLLIPSSGELFREICVLPKLMKLVTMNNKNKNVEQRNQGCKLIISSFTAISGCALSSETIQLYVLPALKLLQANANLMEASQSGIITRIISSMEEKFKEVDKPKGR